MTTIRIGSRGSRLALWQAEHVQRLLADRCGLESELVIVKTSGDRFQEGPVGDLGLKGVFIKELEEALLDGRADLAVHSMKDVPTEIDSRFSFPAVLPREDPRDCLVARDGLGLDQLPKGAHVGTSSLRRQAQLRHYRPDLQLQPLRGNVDTRLAKLERGEYDAIVLAKAGLDRLGLSSRITEVISSEVLLPAVGQGALGLETRAGEPALCKLLATVSDSETLMAVNAERALLAELEGGCQVPVGAWARHEKNGRLRLDACVVSPDGAEFLRQSAGLAGEDAASRPAAQDLGRSLGKQLVAAGADRILRALGRNR